VSGLSSITNTAGFHRIVLQADGAHVYAFAFERAGSPFPEWDYLLDSWEEAREFCRERWGVPPDSWQPTNEQPDSN
jgi:hypothetical protein